MNSTLSRVDGTIPIRPGGLLGTLNDYYELGKPRVVYLLLITTAAAMMMAARGIPPLKLVFWTLLGGALSATSAAALNCVYERDIDGLMKRTKSRPVVTGRISPRDATIYALVVEVLSFAILYVLATPLAAWLSLVGHLYYVGIYTVWLKRRTALNIVIGGAAGAIPPLVGWAAVTGSLGWPALGLFLLIFLWTPPHFWALALMTNIDYDKAGVPMLTTTRGVERTRVEIVVYSIVLVAMSLSLYPLHVMGLLYFAAATILGAIFLYDAYRTLRDETKEAARALFKFSLLYLALMCLVMVADRIIT